ncbi:class I SAM-dependent methyltransferase [Streptomyces sp. NPDC058701]|uniref:class I SAM-dependent methyltransferase n=1 Tax=Streptomyces sp. NPDC058701 TaxID=3346608 RepID=UPI003665ED57
MSDTLDCRSCGSSSLEVFLSLGDLPLADALVTGHEVANEARYPLDVAFCHSCTLVQILQSLPPRKLFVDNYWYFSSASPALIRHARQHAHGLVRDRRLTSRSLVVEVASNDGYFLQHFAEHGVPVLGIDPAPGQAATAGAAGVPVLEEFFDQVLAQNVRRAHGPADVIVANNVLAHVPDLNGFVAGLHDLLADDGIITVENPYVRDLLQHNAFDTIYHEHFSYLSCTSVQHLVQRHGLFLNHVEYFPWLHGGTLRWHLGRKEHPSEQVWAYLDSERRDLHRVEPYRQLADSVERLERTLPAMLRDLRERGARIAAYGAAAKGTVLLNRLGIGPDLVDFVVDRNTHKHGKLMPGQHLPILPTEALLEQQPDYVLLLTWNFAEEILAQQSEYRRRGGRFIMPLPTPEVLPA